MKKPAQPEKSEKPCSRSNLKYRIHFSGSTWLLSNLFNLCKMFAAISAVNFSVKLVASFRPAEFYENELKLKMKMKRKLCFAILICRLAAFQSFPWAQGLTD